MSIHVPDELALHHGGKDLLPGALKFAETFEVWGGMQTGMRVLDIGCGPGRMALGIGERFGWDTRYDGFDIKKADIDFCQSVISKTHPSFQFHHFDLFNDHYNKGGDTKATDIRFPAEDKVIDFIFATSIYTHFFVEDIRHYLSETARVCKGRSLSSWFLIDDRFDKGAKADSLRFDFPHQAEDGTYYQHEKSPLDAVGHSLDSVKALHEEAGMRVVGVFQGAWTGRATVTENPVRHSQDVVVAEPI